MQIRDYLRDRRVPFDTLLHAPAHCATRLAQSLHVPGGRVAKAVLLRGEAGYVLAVLPATHRIEMGRLAETLHEGELRLATEDEIERVFDDCELGAVPPFGQLYGLRTFIDTSLAGGPEIVFEGNARHEGMRMRFRDYEAVERPRRARFATAIAPRRVRAPQQKAN